MPCEIILFGGDADESWQVAHAALVELARERAGLDFEEGRWLVAAKHASVHRQLGYASFVEYAERLFGYMPRVTQDKLRVAQALEELPELSRELRAGTLSFSQVRELTRVATAETEIIWAEYARNQTSRQVEKLVAGRSPGSLPSSPVQPDLLEKVLRFEVSNETYGASAKRWRSCVATLASTWTTTPRFFYWHVTCSAVRQPTVARAIRWRSTFAKTAN